MAEDPAEVILRDRSSQKTRHWHPQSHSYRVSTCSRETVQFAGACEGQIIWHPTTADRGKMARARSTTSRRTGRTRPSIFTSLVIRISGRNAVAWGEVSAGSGAEKGLRTHRLRTRHLPKLTHHRRKKRGIRTSEDTNSWNRKAHRPPRTRHAPDESWLVTTSTRGGMWGSRFRTRVGTHRRDEPFELGRRVDQPGSQAHHRGSWDLNQRVDRFPTVRKKSPPATRPTRSRTAHTRLSIQSAVLCEAIMDLSSPILPPPT